MRPRLATACFRRGRFASLLATALLAGCAGNAVVVERGHDLSQAGAAAATGVGAYLDEVQRRHLASNVALVASDPGCRWEPTIRVAIPIAYRAGQPPRSLCVDAAGRVPPGYRAFRLSLAPISKEALAPTLALVAGLADYIDALDLVLEAKTPDIAKEVADAQAKLADARTLANQLGAGVPELAPLGEEQVNAITGLAQLFTDLAVEARKARALRRIDARDSKTLDATLASLRDQIDLWQQLWAKSDAQQTVQAYEIAQRAPWRPQDFASRQALIQGLVEARRDEAGVDALGATVKTALERVADAERDLRRVLAGDLNETEKRERAALIRRRIWRTLTSLGAIAAAF